MRTLVAALLVGGAASVSGCRNEIAAPRHTGPPRLASPAELTPAERLHGVAPVDSAGVTFQPDVVMPAAGANAVRGISADGFTWTLDPAASGLDEIQKGKVLFLTSRVAGRVLDVDRRGDGVKVVLGPVELTDVIRDGSFAVDTPVDFGQALSYTAPDIHTTPTTLPRLARRFAPAMVLPAAFEQAQPPLRFDTTPLVSSNGIGVRITAATPSGLQFLGEAVLYLKAPQLHFVLDIRNARVNVCEVSLTGAAGLLMNFEATSSNGVRANINEQKPVGFDFSIPVVGMGVPFAVTVRQAFVLRTAFTANGALKARGYYTFTGGLRVGYRDGQFSVGGPAGLGTKQSLLDSAAGVSMGAAGLVMIHQAKVIVGIGAFGFATGPYVALNSSVAVSRGSDIGIVVCKGATLSMDVAAGIGYLIPQAVTNAINFILRGLNLGEIKGSGGFQTPPTKIVSSTSYTPKVRICQQ